MSRTLSELPNAPVSFFKKRTFWTGCVLWFAVLVAAAAMLYRKPIGSEDAVEVVNETESSGKPKVLVIKKGKDGNVTIGEQVEGDSLSPWDQDGIADFALIDTEGKTRTKADFLGKPWVVCFVFTHCALTCPRVTKSMRELQDQLKDCDFHLVTLTVDPVRDTPEVLKGYGESYGADFQKWSFLGGEQRDIYQLIHGSFKMPVQELFEEKRKMGFEFIHSNNIMLVDELGVVRGKFDATKGPDMSALRREIQKIAKRLSETPSEPEAASK